MGNKDTGSGTYDFSGSKYFSIYEKQKPIYFYYTTSGARDDSQFNFSKSKYLSLYKEGTITAPSSSGPINPNITSSNVTANSNWKNIT